jgi:small GTP-binding protein
LVYDVSTRATFERLPLWREEIQAVLPHVPMVLVGNKIDLPRQVSTREGRALAEVWGAPFIETSCLTGDGVQDLFRLLEEAARNSVK